MFSFLNSYWPSICVTAYLFLILQQETSPIVEATVDQSTNSSSDCSAITNSDFDSNSKTDYSSSQCGVFSNISGSIHQLRTARILGGKDVLIEEFPWHSSLQKLRIILPLPIIDWRHICGASIINEYWLLTAAHCVDGLLNSLWPGQLRVVLGTDRWRYTLLQQKIQLLPVAKITIHPEWNSRKAQNDIALIRTTKPIQFNERVRPICLPDNKDYEIRGGKSVIVAGYGYTTDNLIFNILPDKLKAVKVPVVRMDNCRKTYNISRIPITDKMICAGITTYGRCSGAMRGDSGSALITYQNGRAVHTGIVSFSLPCRMFGAPDVYTRTSSYLEWIDSIIKSN